jgi:hypothetical protein
MLITVPTAEALNQQASMPTAAIDSMLAHHNEWHSALVQQSTHATVSNVDPAVYVLLMVCVLTVVTMLMTQRGRAAPERRTPTAATLNPELQAMSTFRRQMTAYLNREPTATELEDERRRLTHQAYVQKHGFSPLSPEQTPPHLEQPYEETHMRNTGNVFNAPPSYNPKEPSSNTEQPMTCLFNRAHTPVTTS